MMHFTVATVYQKNKNDIDKFQAYENDLGWVAKTWPSNKTAFFKDMKVKLQSENDTLKKQYPKFFSGDECNFPDPPPIIQSKL